MHRRHGPVALLHFDAHLDTWDTYFGAAYTHGTPFRRAWEEGLLLEDERHARGDPRPAVLAGGPRGRRGFGFAIVTAMDVLDEGRQAVAAGSASRLGDAPVYVSIDIDVLDPALRAGDRHAGGRWAHEPRAPRDPPRARGLHLVGADIVEVAPPYDHAEITAVAASHVAYELLALFAVRLPGRTIHRSEA